MPATRGGLFRRVVVAAIVVGMLGGRAGHGQPAPPAAPQIGIVSSDPAGFAAARAAGARSVKILADWSVIEPARGQASWVAVDRVVATAVREGLAPVVILAHTPRWASVGTGADLARPEIYSRQPPRDVRDWERFVTAAGRRYRGRVLDWQVWTQLGLPFFRGTGSEYLALLKASRVRLRETDPAARVALATPTGVDLGFIVRVSQDASAAFDSVALSPQGVTPEGLLRPLAVLGARVKPSGKAVWVDWAPEPGMPEDQVAASWARLLGVAQAGGVERVFVAGTGQIGPGVRQAAAAVLSGPFGGYLVRDPGVFAVVIGGGGEASLVAWATADGRVLEVTGAQRLVRLDGRPVATENRDGRSFARLSLTPIAAVGVTAAMAEEARTVAAARGALVPVVSPDRDFSQATDVSARLGRLGEERGLYNLPYRTRRNGAVEPVEVAGVEAVQTSVARQVTYVYFDLDDTFLYFAEGRVPIEVVVEVWGARAARQIGFNLLYDSNAGYRFTPWLWVDVHEGWVTHTIRLADATMANTWGWDFAINTAGNRSDDLIVRSVTVRRAVP